MKKILVILTKSNLTQLQTVESLSATMVLATFGCNISVVLQDEAINLLHQDLKFDTSKHAFKLASNLVDGFEFYDIDDVYIPTRQADHPFVQHTTHQIQTTLLDADFLQQFDHVLYW